MLRNAPIRAYIPASNIRPEPAKTLAGLGGACIGRRVHECSGPSAFVDHPSRVLLLGLKSNDLLVELPG